MLYQNFINHRIFHLFHIWFGVTEIFIEIMLKFHLICTWSDKGISYIVHRVVHRQMILNCIYCIECSSWNRASERLCGGGGGAAFLAYILYWCKWIWYWYSANSICYTYNNGYILSICFTECLLNIV